MSAIDDAGDVGIQLPAQTDYTSTSIDINTPQENFRQSEITAENNTPAQVAIQSIPAGSGFSVTGVLDGVKATSDTLIGLYKTYTGIQNTALALKVQDNQTKGSLQLQQAQLDANIAASKKAIASGQTVSGITGQNKNLSPFEILGFIIIIGVISGKIK